MAPEHRGATAGERPEPADRTGMALSTRRTGTAVAAAIPTQEPSAPDQAAPTDAPPEPASEAGRQTRKSAATRARLIEATIACLVKYGYAQTVTPPVDSTTLSLNAATTPPTTWPRSPPGTWR